MGPHRTNAEEKMVKYLDFLSSLLDASLKKPPPPFALSFILDEFVTSAIDIWYLQIIFKEKSLITSLVKLVIIDNAWTSSELGANK